MLGEDYPGYFPVGDTQALTTLLERTEQDQQFYHLLHTRCNALRPMVDPATEQQSWKDLLDELDS